MKIEDIRYLTEMGSNSNSLKLPSKLIEEALPIHLVEQKFLELFSQCKINGTLHTCVGQAFSTVDLKVDQVLSGGILNLCWRAWNTLVRRSTAAHWDCVHFIVRLMSSYLMRQRAPQTVKLRMR